MRTRKKSGKKSIFSSSKGTLKRKVLIIITLIVLLTVAIITVSYLVKNNANKKKKLDIIVNFPGQGTESINLSDKESSDNMRIGVNSKLYFDGLVADTIAIPYSTREREAILSGSFRLSDQVELLSFYAQTGDKKRYKELFKNINLKFKTKDGLYNSFLPESEELVFSASTNIRLSRALFEGYATFGNNEYVERAIEISEGVYLLSKDDKILPAEIKIKLAKATPTPNLEASPTPKPTATPTEDIEFIPETILAVDISTIDLYALKLLTQIDSKWEQIYNNSLQIILNSKLNYPGPFFSEGYYPENDGYTAYISQSQAAFDFKRQIMAALHLAEVGELDKETYSYIKEKLINDRAFYTKYDLLTGAQGSGTESIIGYAAMANIARIFKDDVVYELCAGRIFWNSATSYTSKIFGLTFIEESDGTIISSAFDSIFSIKALY